MRLIIPDKVNKNCHVFKMGFTYPVCVYSYYDYTQAVKILTEHPSFGEYATEYHYSYPPHIRGIYEHYNIPARRYYAGQRQWRNVQRPRRDFWIVFKSERDRTLAMMLLA